MLWRFIVRVFAVIGFLCVLLIGGAAWLIYEYVLPEGVEAPAAAVLRIDLRNGVADRPPDDALTTVLTGGAPSLHQIVDAIDAAAADDRVVGLVADLSGDRFGMAAAQELRAAVERFRDSGKPALAYADSLGEFAPGNNAYLLASAFEAVWLNPVGSVGLTGIVSEVPFAGTALEDFGVDAQFVRRGPYKSSPELLTESSFTPEHREMVAAMVDGLYDQLVAGIADSRGMDEAAVRQAVDRGPLLAAEAEEHGLVDRLASRPLFDAHLETTFESAEMLGPLDYLGLSGPPAEPQATIAVIYANGIITVDGSDDIEMVGDAVINANELSALIDDTVEDPAVDAIVLRIDSGGGSAVGSAIIGRSIEQAVERGLPVIVSMGAAAASGGYWIAAPATEIVALPATLTGSIGVFAGKIVARDLLADVGVNWGLIQRGRNATIWSSFAPYTVSGMQRVNALVDDLYDRFVGHVAERRGLSREAVEAVAEGRVWTGEQALERGLVDQLGGLHTALDAARRAASLSDDAQVVVTVRPEPAAPLDQVLDLVTSLQSEREISAVALGLQALGGGELLRSPGETLLTMPPVGLMP